MSRAAMDRFTELQSFQKILSDKQTRKTDQQHRQVHKNVIREPEYCVERIRTYRLAARRDKTRRDETILREEK
jgi:hypothetical protein